MMARRKLIWWRAVIVGGKKGRALGLFEAPDDEAAAREAAIEQFGIEDARDLLGLALQRAEPKG